MRMWLKFIVGNRKFRAHGDWAPSSLPALSYGQTVFEEHLNSLQKRRKRFFECLSLAAHHTCPAYHTQTHTHTSSISCTTSSDKFVCDLTLLQLFFFAFFFCSQLPANWNRRRNNRCKHEFKQSCHKDKEGGFLSTQLLLWVILGQGLGLQLTQTGHSSER